VNQGAFVDVNPSQMDNIARLEIGLNQPVDTKVYQLQKGHCGGRKGDETAKAETPPAPTPPPPPAAPPAPETPMVAEPAAPALSPAKVVTASRRRQAKTECRSSSPGTGP